MGVFSSCTNCTKLCNAPHVKTSQLIGFANQVNCFYMIIWFLYDYSRSLQVHFVHTIFCISSVLFLSGSYRDLLVHQSVCKPNICGAVNVIFVSTFLSGKSPVNASFSKSALEMPLN